MGPRYVYEGFCPLSGTRLRLPRTVEAEASALELADTLPALGLQEGKMFGVLLAIDAEGRHVVGKAFSGAISGRAELEGWVAPFARAESTPLEVATLAALASWKERLTRLKEELDAHPFPALKAAWMTREAELRESQRQAKLERARVRQEGALELRDLDAESRADSSALRDFKAARREALSRSEGEHAALEAALRHGKAERRATSRTLQAEMHEGFARALSAGLNCRLEDLYPDGVPTGTGDCCAPKLLAWSAREDLTPVGMAEFWWGPTSVGGKVSGEFYPACEERCGPLMGPLLAQALRPRLAVLHEDDALVVVDKPSGLLSVPGRYAWNQDSALSRLRERWPELRTVHRLDLETSGLLVFAKRIEAQAELQRQFAGREVEKVYEALVGRAPTPHEGRVDDALGPDPQRSGCYMTDPEGKPAVTLYRVLDASEGRLELRPLTGRSHQLRVHLAQSLGAPIRGDRLYGGTDERERLMLHARELTFKHPANGGRASFHSPAPF